MDSALRPSKARGIASSTELSMKQPPPAPEGRSRFQKVSLVSRRLEQTAAGGARDGSPSRVSLLLQAWEREIVEKTSTVPAPVAPRSCSSSVGVLKDFTAHGPVFSQVYSPAQKPRRKDEKQGGDNNTAAPRDVPVHRESYMHGALLPASPAATAAPCHRSPRGGPGAAEPRARHVTVLRGGKEGAGSKAGGAEGRRTQNGVHKAAGTATAPSQRESCEQGGGGSAEVAARTGSSPGASGAGGAPGEKCLRQGEAVTENAASRDGDRPQDQQTSKTSAQQPPEDVGSQADQAGVGEGSTMDGDGTGLATLPRTESSGGADGTPENLSLEVSNGPEPLPEARASPKGAEAEKEEVEMSGDPQKMVQGPESIPEPPTESIPEPQPESTPEPPTETTPEPPTESTPEPQPESTPEPERTPEPPQNPPAPSPLPESPQDAAEEDPELVVDMEIFVDTLRNMEPSEMRKAPKAPRQPRPSALGRCAALPPIHEDRVAPRAPVSLPDALRELLARGGGGQRAEPPPESSRSLEEEEEEDEEEEEEIENPYLSPGERASWGSRRGSGEPDTLRGGPKLEGAGERSKAAPGRVAGERSVLFRGNVLKGMALLSDFLEHRAAAADEAKPYSRLDNSVLYSRFVAPTPPCREQRDQSSPPGEHHGTEVAELEAPGPGHIQPVTEEPESTMEPCPGDVPQEDEEESFEKINTRPGKIVLFSEAGFAGHRREIWGDVPDATSWELSHTISIRVIRGGWVMYEKPRFHGRKCVLAEGDVEIDNPWAAYGQGTEPRGSRPFRIGSFKRVVRDYRTPEISLFAEENGEGARLKFTDSAEDTRAGGRALAASSIIVHSGLWLVYSKPFFDDDPYVLEPGGYPNLKAWGAKDPAICSLHPIRLGCPVVERPGEPQVLIYEDAGFQGRSSAVNRDIYDLRNLPGLALPTLGSLRVLGGCWVGYEKEGFRGHQYLLEEGEYHDWRQWGGYNKELVSLRLIRTDFSDPALVLFEAMDFEEGPSVELSEALPDTQLAGYGTVTQSIHVLSGVWVAYEGPNFSGEQYVLEKGVYRNCEDWGAADCRIASAQPILQVGERNLHFVSKILLFSEPDFLGEHLAFEEEQGSLPDGFVPRSCRVRGGSWILFDGREFSGEQHVLSEGEYPTLGAMGCLSSATIRSLKKVPVFFSEPSIFLHGLECFEGKEIELNSEVRSLQAEGFNNHVLSVRVKGGIWVLCEHGDFRGRQWLLDCTEITNWLTYSGLQHVGSLYPIRQRRIYFRIRSKELELYLSVPDDVEDMKAGRVVVSSLSEQSSSVWYYEDGLLKNQVAPTMSLQVIGPAAKGSKAVLWSETRMPRQTWSIDAQGRIRSQMFEDMILDVKGGRSYDRDHAIIWDAAEERPTQIWDVQVL
ncbi:beta/gamma crystallin domain-containing protein 2 [Aythya fuligula]|uniref:Beta/gamma crystallin domain-containing protein 2 n=1 Tax=Aythya fuligula TaxID=219594 RepID=A0A6J3E5F0_AYTFU|nr:beta/gamma crystallin domain-containing protein 2 [Aythya fuligula]